MSEQDKTDEEIAAENMELLAKVKTGREDDSHESPILALLEMLEASLFSYGSGLPSSELFDGLDKLVPNKLFPDEPEED